MGETGKRIGSRRATKPRPSLSLSKPVLALTAGVTLCVVAWGYLVYAAIDFGTTARAGESSAWGFLVLASLGAVACLFVGMMLIARLLRRLGLGGTSATSPAAVETPRPPGGRRAAR